MKCQPRVFEKFLEAIKEQGSKAPYLKQKVATWARAVGAQVFAQQEHGNTAKKPCGYGVAKSLVFSKVLDKLGLDKAYVVICGAAPLSPDVQATLGSLGLTVHEGYGLSETSAVATLSGPSHFKPGSVGKAIEGTEVIIGDADADGE
jgi:long-subunit acyl-CoA synthetase (AMP-forming)